MQYAGRADLPQACRDCGTFGDVTGDYHRIGIRADRFQERQRVNRGNEIQVDVSELG